MLTLVRKSIAAIDSLGFPIASVLDADYLAKRDAFASSVVKSWLDKSSTWAERRLLGGGNFDERVVEYGEFARFMMSLKNKSRILDVGMTTNNAVLAPVLDQFATGVVFLNPSPDKKIFTKKPTQILTQEFGVVEALEKNIDVLVSISTIEHIGWSNLQYGNMDKPRYKKPTAEPLLDFIRLADYFLRPIDGSFFATVPCGKSGRNIHPKTLRFASQTFGREALESAQNLAGSLGFGISVRIFSVDGDDWLDQGDRLDMVPTRTWRMRYGARVPAARSVAVISGSRLA